MYTSFQRKCVSGSSEQIEQLQLQIQKKIAAGLLINGREINQNLDFLEELIDILNGLIIKHCKTIAPPSQEQDGFSFSAALGESPINVISEEIKLLIFDYLPSEDLRTASTVCKLWNSESHWKDMCKRLSIKRQRRINCPLTWKQLYWGVRENLPDLVPSESESTDEFGSMEGFDLF